MKNILSFVALSGCLLLLTPSLHAQELTAEESANKAYVFGFLAGLQHVGNETVAIQKEAQSKVQSEFFQRAYKSRLGREPERYSSNDDEKFCLPDAGISDHELQNMLSKFHQISLNNQADKAQQLFQVVQTTYPCS